MKVILISIEKQHQVKFNYIDDVVAPFEITAPETSLLLQQKLNEIHDKTGLIFEFIDGKYIIVTAEKKDIQVV
ncbi:MAG TPA: hypothetical protein VK476_01890, partial [Flavobacterium sp.]|nr:hypothetical protein [Flavobacterium sp.]